MITYQIHLVRLGDLEAQLQMCRQQHYLADQQLWTQQIVLVDVAQHLAEPLGAGSHGLSINPDIARHASGAAEKEAWSSTE